MNLRQVLVQTVIGLIAILIAVLYAMFIVPQDWFIDSRESVVTISVIICATGYIITVWPVISVISHAGESINESSATPNPR